ncbi:hypothetical protein BJ684DRAFT_16593 [Piptocephalis cylindrospora]|uniref:Uncharacterized protein n=1 Tax=Piptocephalis cylindrospora TaxID=1907219 RepID=A0A4P9Y275_9FUNG|nr:hypothetical protein BJ684DRAFT_16593 [Piptocephalis cylindrospora]|eukprot:RKP12968.1 hypothetical protein BJ684DRAFT_16593 [Piptocephalis cylindrospora]
MLSSILKLGSYPYDILFAQRGDRNHHDFYPFGNEGSKYGDKVISVRCLPVSQRVQLELRRDIDLYRIIVEGFNFRACSVNIHKTFLITDEVLAITVTDLSIPGEEELEEGLRKHFSTIAPVMEEHQVHEASKEKSIVAPTPRPALSTRSPAAKDQMDSPSPPLPPVLEPAKAGSKKGNGSKKKNLFASLWEGASNEPTRSPTPPKLPHPMQTAPTFLKDIMSEVLEDLPAEEKEDVLQFPDK